jgi:hypothetical protein
MKIVYYVACSLDGYIATRNGGVELAAEVIDLSE